MCEGPVRTDSVQLHPSGADRLSWCECSRRACAGIKNSQRSVRTLQKERGLANKLCCSLFVIWKQIWPQFYPSAPNTAHCWSSPARIACGDVHCGCYYNGVIIITALRSIWDAVSFSAARQTHSLFPNYKKTQRELTNWQRSLFAFCLSETRSNEPQVNSFINSCDSQHSKQITVVKTRSQPVD